MRLLSLSIALLLNAPASPPEADGDVDAGTGSDSAPAGDEGTPPAQAPQPSDASDAPALRVEARTVPLEAGPVDAEVLDTVLPCGLRVRVARDDSLPVAAVVLAVETGTIHDPKAAPGLVHALAFHLLMGGNELRPGQALADVRDFGGLAGLAVGLGQVRFESLTPWAQLDRALAIEARRLRAPTLRHELWLKALSYARRDDRPSPPLPHQARALAWSQPGLAHEGREVHKGLPGMPEGAVGAQLSQLFAYTRATLVVVSPAPVNETLEQVASHFEDFPRATRIVPSTIAPPVPAEQTRELPLPKQKGDTYVWPVPADPASQVWAQTACKAIGRMPTLEGEAKNTRVACTYAPDARFPALVLRANGPDRLNAITSRFDALAAGTYEELWRSAAESTQRSMRSLERQPLQLAIMLARATESVTPAAGVSAIVDFTGRSAAAPESSATGQLPTLLNPAAGVHLVRRAKPATPSPREEALDERPPPKADPPAPDPLEGPQRGSVEAGAQPEDPVVQEKPQ